ncbi:hypothetical protein AAULR_05663, partial [Lacticaseibacillus rhamnosus MTCC 5462]
SNGHQKLEGVFAARLLVFLLFDPMNKGSHGRIKKTISAR